MDKRISLIILTAIILALTIDALIDYAQLSIQKAGLERKALAAVYEGRVKETVATTTVTATKTTAPSLSITKEGLEKAEGVFGRGLKELYDRMGLLVADVAIALAIALIALLVFRKLSLKG
ncbi:MAG: hypothetical protein DRN59_00730 [Thaumarchaeota archaeon]|nr:MAG: hypothetical protein DRN59_00730 [Nitrososphaerota archaeon]